jgi:predicted ArsR family transcriptional regulator
MERPAQHTQHTQPAPGIALARGTKGTILRLLRGQELTVDDLAAQLGVTANGVRFHLTELERDGLVVQRSARRGPRKPSHVYSLAPPAEALFPRVYGALLNAVLREVRAGRTNGGSGDMEALFRRLGRELAGDHAHRFRGMAREGRAAEALKVLEEIGGAAALLPDGEGGAVVTGQSCPFMAVVPEHPEVCALLEAFLAEALPDVGVRETCDRGKDGRPPRCRFELRWSVAPTAPAGAPTEAAPDRTGAGSAGQGAPWPRESRGEPAV